MAHDHILVTFDAFNDNRNAMCFATNAYGVQRDYLSFDDLYFDIDWDGLWKVRTTEQIQAGVQKYRFPGKHFGTRNQAIPLKIGDSIFIETGGFRTKEQPSLLFPEFTQLHEWNMQVY